MSDGSQQQQQQQQQQVNAGAFNLDLPFDANLIPADRREAFGDAKFEKWGDLINHAAEASTRAKTAGQFSKDMKLDLAALPPEYGKIFGAKKIETVGALADMAFNGEKLIGGMDKFMGKPEPGKLVEWMANNKDVLGVPGKPDDYGWNKPQMPEGLDFDAETEGAFRKFAHERNLPADMFQDFADFGANLLIGAHKRGEAARLKETEDATTALKADWGGDFDKNRELAVFAARNLGLSEATINRLSNSEIGAPETLRLLAKLGAGMDGASLINGDGATLSQGAAAAKAKLEAFERDPVKMKAFRDKGDSGHAAAVEEHENLMKGIYGS